MPRRIFIVHGHDEAAREAVARFLERMDFEVVILHERANKGRTIITKFWEEAAQIGFAVVLMTPDDHGGKSGAERSPRARQNVVFELGFFIGVLGPDRVAALVKGKVERPSDYDGVSTSSSTYRALGKCSSRENWTQRGWRPIGTRRCGNEHPCAAWRGHDGPCV